MRIFPLFIDKDRLILYNMRVILKLKGIVVMKAEYNTKQRQALSDFLKQNRSRQFSINEITEAVKDSGIGKSTLYRNVSRLVTEGEVRRFRGEGKSVLYQYVGHDHGCNSHFHLKCNGCGRLFHVDCQSVMGISEHISRHHDFAVDVGNTVFYGTCGSCKRGEAAE